MSSEALDVFVHDALTAGRSRGDIAAALKGAGWSGKEVEDALAAYAEGDFVPPVPRPRPQLTARDAFVYLVLFTALGFTAGNLIGLILNILDILMPDADATAYDLESAVDSIRFSIASLVVAGPVFLWMTVYTRRQLARDEGHRRSLVRKWLTYLAMFVAALIFLGDATFVIYSILDGNLTLRLALKALAFAVVFGAMFVFYLRDVEEMHAGD